MKIIGLKDLRIKEGLTQKQAAGLIYHSDKAWQHWERGYRTIPKHILELFLVKLELMSDKPNVERMRKICEI